MSENNLTEAPIKNLIGQIAFPVCIGFFFNTMFNVVDTYFGGKLGTEALAALSLSFPVYFLLMIFDSGISTGVTAVIANALGAKKEVEKYIGQSISFGLIVSIFVTALGLIFSPALFRLLGATGHYLEMSVAYMNVFFYGTVFFLMESVLNSFLQARGDTKTYRNFLIIGFFLNVILDPILLYGDFGIPALGFRGVALATVIVQIFGVCYMFYRVHQTGLISKDIFRKLKPEWQTYKEILEQAVPASLNMVTIGAGIFVITYFINQFGQTAVAAYGIATRIEQIALLPTIGLTIASLTIVGQNNGAKRFDRVRETLKLCVRYGLQMMLIGCILIFGLGEFMMKLFATDPHVVAIGAHYLKIAAFISFAYAILFINVSALQGMKKPMYAVWIGLYRQIIAPFILFTVLVKVFGFGINGIWWGIFGITWSGAIITHFYSRYTLKRLKA